METVLFAIPASDKLVRKIQVVLQRSPDAPLELVREAVRDAGMQYVDDVVDGMVLTFVQRGETRRFMEVLLANFATVIKTVCHGVIHQAVRQAQHEDLAAVTGFFRERVLTTVKDGQKRNLIAFAPNATHQMLLRQLAEAGQSGADPARDTYVRLIQGMVDESVYHHFEAPFALLELGFFTRRAVELGRKAILAAGHGVASRAIRDDSNADLSLFSRFLTASLVPATMCRRV